MAWVFFNKLKNGIVKIAKGIGKVLKLVAQALLPVAKQVPPTIVETAGNAFKPGLGTIAEIGVNDLMNCLDNVINGDQKQTIAYDDSNGRQKANYIPNYTDMYEGYIPKQPQLIDKSLSFQTKELTPDFVPHAKGFIGKRRQTTS